VVSAVFSADESSILTASGDGTVKVWDRANGDCKLTLSGHSDRVSSAVFSADESSILTASDDGTVKVWDRANGDCKLTLSGDSGYIRFAMFVTTN